MAPPQPGTAGRGAGARRGGHGGDPAGGQGGAGPGGRARHRGCRGRARAGRPPPTRAPVRGAYADGVVLRGTAREVTGRGSGHAVRAPVVVLGGEDWAQVPLGARVRATARLAVAEARGDPVSALVLAVGAPHLVARPGPWWRRRGDGAVLPARLRGAPAGRPAGPGAGPGRRGRRRPRPGPRRGLPCHRADPPARRVRDQPDPGRGLPARAGQVVRRSRPGPLRRRRARDRRLRAARPDRAERRPCGGDGDGGAARHGGRRPAPRSAGAGSRGGRPAAARPVVGTLGRVRAVRRSRPRGSWSSRPASATPWPGGSRAGWPRPSRCRWPRSSRAPRSSPRSPDRSAWSRSAPTWRRPPPWVPRRCSAWRRVWSVSCGTAAADCWARSPAGASGGSSSSPSAGPRCPRQRSGGGPGCSRWCCSPVSSSCSPSGCRGCWPGRRAVSPAAW